MKTRRYKILVLLAQYMGKVLTHDMIVRAIWGSARAGMEEVTNLRVFMTSLRKSYAPTARVKGISRRTSAWVTEWFRFRMMVWTGKTELYYNK